MMRTGIFHSVFEDLDEMRAFVGRAAQDAGFDDSGIYQVQLAVDEACSNIIEHGCHGRCEQEIEITCSDSTQGLRIMIRDHGQSFDPNMTDIPDLDMALEDRPVGGLGIYMMRRLMDELHYETLGEAGNVLTMVKYHKQGT